MGAENQKGAPAEPGAFQKVLGALSQEQKIRALEIARKHGIPDEDPVWHVVLTVAEVEEGLKEVAQSLRESSVAVTAATAAEVKAAREKATLEIAKAQEAAKAALNQALSQMMSSAVQKAVDQIVQSTHAQALRTQAQKWALVGAVTASVLVVALAGGVGWEAYRTGLAGGYASGVVVGGNFQTFLNCDQPGWKIEKQNGKTMCYPLPTPKGTYGWRIR